MHLTQSQRMSSLFQSHLGLSCCINSMSSLFQSHLGLSCRINSMSSLFQSHLGLSCRINSMSSQPQFHVVLSSLNPTMSYPVPIPAWHPLPLPYPSALSNYPDLPDESPSPSICQVLLLCIQAVIPPAPSNLLCSIHNKPLHTVYSYHPSLKHLPHSILHLVTLRHY